MTNEGDLENQSVMIDLLDPASGHVVQVWYLAARPVIRIGRDPDQDVVIAHPYVSRQHAELRFQDGQWLLVSLGRHGVFIDGQRIAEKTAQNGVRFRLGAEGPTIRFVDTPPVVSRSTMTITSDDTIKLALQVNESKVEQEVGEIVGGDYFRQLQERARELRRKRDG